MYFQKIQITLPNSNIFIMKTSFEKKKKKESVKYVYLNNNF